ncbi:MAG: metal-dependent hydrolase [Candidatus Aminicenantes bacterium]|nr:metal-dependent hydrolase [Candidatus Aminicenantes bacterium]
MPLPIGHALAGLACAQVRPGFFFRNRWYDAFFFVFLANLPDADFLPGIILGHPNLYHHGIFHSVGAALAVAAVGGCFFYFTGHRVWTRAAAIFLVFSSHLLLDLFALDLVAPYGLPLLWPLANRYFIASHPIFINVIRSGRANDFFISLFNRHNMSAAGREILILGGALAAVVVVRRLLKKKDH